VFRHRTGAAACSNTDERCDEREDCTDTDDNVGRSGSGTGEGCRGGELARHHHHDSQNSLHNNQYAAETARSRLGVRSCLDQCPAQVRGHRFTAVRGNQFDVAVDGAGVDETTGPDAALGAYTHGQP
jgi:hypothetical protein